MAKQKSGGNPRDAAKAMAEALKRVFHDYSLSARSKAWDKLTHGAGMNFMQTLVKHPDYSISNLMGKLTFKEWLEERESL